MIEKVSGKTYRSLLQERIFDLLGMKDTGLDADDLILPRGPGAMLRDRVAWVWLDQSQ